MNRVLAAATFGCAGLLALSPDAWAHVVAGARVFPVTLTFDDPGVGDEISAPAFTFSRSGADGGTGPSHEFDYGFEFDKTITENTALILNDGYDVIQTNGSKTEAGFENLFITGKWQAITNADHELVVSLGITRELGGSGTVHIGADHYGSTTPNFYFGKGFGDLPGSVLKPFAVTGELSYTIADKGLKVSTPVNPNADAASSAGVVSQFNTGNNNAWSGSLSLQYSIPYLQTQVHDYKLPGFLANMIPVVELDWTSPASSPSTQGTTWTVAPGVIYLAGWGELGVEALIPVNKAAGTNVGAVALVHVFLDDLLPHSLGKPIFD
ncbi:hypothetical protein [Lichenicola sp.]|uniref:hypothetical protein n=1 Tax=Lichenicola sp. TaxID=2804529 RepID=UPI003B00AFB1